jgi:hypothetical protein
MITMHTEYPTFFSNPKLFPSFIPTHEVTSLHRILEEDNSYQEWEWLRLLSKILENDGENMEEEDLQQLAELNKQLIAEYAEPAEDNKADIPEWLAYQSDIVHDLLHYE